MDGAADRHRRFAGAMTHRIEGVTDWSVPTPVSDWTAVDVVDHLITWSGAFLAAGGVDLAAGPPVADEPLAAWSHHVGQVQELLDAPDADRVFVHPYAGEHPLATAIDRFYTADVFMHTWDLARATGQDDSLDADFCADLLAGLRPIDDVLRTSGQYGPAVPVPADATVQEQLLGFIGRDPAWQP
ncbi:maleylpyruvate isomerase family mycothiol-dependent enzyme [Aeromicrobium sp. Sec7.5]|uniref:maleylpyruvate isomerase family mycothiol-dependent enzyme n=1 Tax=Aeromicrobium sp. Sec7.5 TaxID=3121276 RepID=UPI002FE44A50